MKILTCFLVFISFAGTSQSVFRKAGNQINTFKNLQLQFVDFKKTHDLTKTKHWKNFKRYENEMQRHTNASGEPAGFSTYIEEALKVANEKQNSSQPSPWFPVGPNNIPNNLTGYLENGIGRVNCVAFHPSNANIFYVGVAQGGLWKTTNGGSSYTCLTDNLPITRISDISIDPVNPNTIYISVCDFEYIGFGLYLNGRKRHTHYGLGVYKSTDGGLTWNSTGLSFVLTDGDASLIKEVVINSSNTNELLACGASGMYRSVNGGNTWTKQLDSLFWDMVQDPVNPSTIYAATGWVMNSNMGHAAIYKSTNFGQTWTMLSTGIPLQGTVQRIKLAIAPSDNNFVYAICSDNTFGFYGMYQSTNAGASWVYKAPVLNILEGGQGTSTGGQGTYDLALCVDATNKNKIYAAGINIWMSSDGGTTFDPVSHWTTSYGPTLHGDVHYIERQPGTNSYFACTDGGIYKTNTILPGDWNMNWPTVWINLSDGMQVTSFYRLSSSKNGAGRIIAGAQDNATAYYNGSSWSTIFGGDGMDNYLDPLNNQNVFGSSQYGYFYFSNDGGQSSTTVGSNPNFESSEWVTPVAAHYNTPGLLYLGNENVVKSTDGGQNWTALATIFSNTVTNTSTEISALAVSNTNSNVIYAARRVRYEFGIDAIVFKSVNGGLSFTNITSNLPDTLFYTDIDVSETSSNEAVVCMAGFASGCKVFKTTNGGSSWSNISFNLPNIPVNCVKYVPGTGQIVVATDLGVYVLNSGASTWTSYSTGLPNVIVSDIEFNPALNKMYVSTFGRGIWETNLSILSSLQNSEKIQVLSFRVYPAVNDGNFIVDAGVENNKLTVIDVMGRVVHEETIASVKELHLNLLPGNYFVRLDNGTTMGVRRIVVK